MQLCTQTLAALVQFRILLNTQFHLQTLGNKKQLRFQLLQRVHHLFQADIQRVSFTKFALMAGSGNRDS